MEWKEGQRQLPQGPVRTPRAEGGAGTSRAGPWRWERSVAQERNPPGVDGVEDEAVRSQLQYILRVPVPPRAPC